MAALPDSLATAICMARRKRGWSQAVVARKLEVSEKVYWRWEAGVGYPSVGNFERMAALFEWPLPYRPNELTETPDEPKRGWWRQKSGDKRGMER
jgi:transcriptional regulator with XRE-family HTH domain